MTFTVAPVDPADTELLDGCLRLEREAVLAARPHADLPTVAHAADVVRHPTDYFHRRLLAAHAGPDLVGMATIGRWVQDNTHLAHLEIAVLPSQHRRGVGTALYDAAAGLLRAEGCTTLIGEAHTTSGGGGTRPFAERLGFTEVHTEDHFVLPLPLPEDRRAELVRAVSQAPGAAAYDIVTWSRRCPDDLVDAYAVLETQMSSDVPVGDLDYQPVVVDVARIRAREELAARHHDTVTAAARHRDTGELVGYSQVFLARGDDVVHQDDTLVMPGHRGHRLGLRLKLTTLEVVDRDHPGRRVIHTSTALDNAPMQRTNRTFGFEPVEVLHEMQRRIDR
jgi:GNAT superfamily N-acetyltransferase